MYSKAVFNVQSGKVAVMKEEPLRRKREPSCQAVGSRTRVLWKKG
jgi:hypothetical protein